MAQTQHIRTGRWSIAMLQHGGSQEMIRQVFDETLRKKARCRAARKLLRDGSALTWLMLFEYMHAQITLCAVPLEQSPLLELTGALRVKALKILGEPSRHDGEDHVSAMRWLQHCVVPEDVDVMCEQLDAYHHHHDLFDQLCLVASHIVGQLALARRDDAVDQLVHVLLFSSTPTTQPRSLINALIVHAPSLDRFHDVLLHASTTCDLRTRGAALQALYEDHPDDFLEQVDAFEQEASRVWTYHDDLLLQLSRSRHHHAQLARRAAQTTAQLHDMMDALLGGEPPHGELLEQLSNASRHAPESLLHGALPHLLECAPHARDLVLDYIPEIDHAIESGRLLSHLFAHAGSPYLKHRILWCCAKISSRQWHRQTCEAKVLQDFQRRLEMMWLDVLGDAQGFARFEATHIDTLQKALVLEPHFCAKVISWLEDTPESFGVSSLTLLSDAARSQPVLSHIAIAHLSTRHKELAASLQRLHDSATHTPLILSLRKLLNAVRKIK